MWSPTHIQVTVQRAKGLLTKGKNGTNNCFVIIGLGKEKYQTSVKDKAESNVSWNEECELKIPDQGNRAELSLTCLHRNNLGIDEFLGQATLPLNEMDVYNRPRSQWFKLESKPGKEKKNKERGELEVRISFIVKSGSLTDLSKKDKHKSSIGQLASSVGGSLLSIGTIEKRKGIRNFAKSLGSKMHLHSKKKHKEGDDASSFSGSLASIGTPTSSTGGSRRYGQRAGEADPGVISEDEDEFVFDNLSHKSSGSSLNIRTGLQPPAQNYTPRNPSPLLGVNGKPIGKPPLPKHDLADDRVIDQELEEIEHDFSVRSRTLPPPSKPPRTPQFGTEIISSSPKATDKEKTLDEWEKKLYGKHLDIGSTDSLKRRSWELARVPLPPTNVDKIEQPTVPKKEESSTQQQQVQSMETNTNTQNKISIMNNLNTTPEASDSSSSSEISEEENVVVPEHAIQPQLKRSESDVTTKDRTASVNMPPQELKLNSSPNLMPRLNLISPDEEKKDFNQFNASFARFEQRNSAKIFELDSDTSTTEEAGPPVQPPLPTTLPPTQSVTPAQNPNQLPQPLPRHREKDGMEDNQEVADRKHEVAHLIPSETAELQLLEERKRRAEDDKRLEAELRLNEQRLQNEELALKEELRRQEEQKRRAAKRYEEDQRILNFAKRSTSVEEIGTPKRAMQEQSPKEHIIDSRKEKRLGKFKYFNKREKTEEDNVSSSPKSTERIIIGHEKSLTHAERRSEISAALARKYEGKSREELMLIANGMENEALMQRQRVKELEDYLDNLLLRVMETHPKILQNPYARTTSAKSG